MYLQVYWSEGGELMCIATEESFFVLKYRTEAVEKARENPESITEDGIEDAFDVSKTVVRMWLNFSILRNSTFIYTVTICADGMILDTCPCLLLVAICALCTWLGTLYL